MPVPSTLADLSVVASTNSPQGADTVTTDSGPDEYMRALSAIIRREQAQAVAVASAATVDLGAIADGNYVHITGVATITSFGTAAAGVSRTLVFDGALTITHNATSLILRDGTNRATAAGDVAEFVSEGSGNWREVDYHTAVVALDPTLTALAGLNATAGLVEQTGEDAFTKTPVSAFIKTLLDDADQATARATLDADNAANLTGNVAAARIMTALNATGTAPVYACRAWVNFDGTGAVPIRASGNVSSITDNGVGDYTVNLTTAMPDSLGACTVSGIGLTDNTAAARNNMYGGYIPTSSTVRVSCWDVSNAAEDAVVVSVAIFR